MKRLISLALCVYIGFSRADEFRLEFSNELANTVENRGDVFDTPASSRVIRSNSAVSVPSLPPVKSGASVADPEPAQNNQVSPPESRRSVHASRADASSPNGFSPLRVAPHTGLSGMMQIGDQSERIGLGGQNSDALTALHDEFKLMVGEDVYSRASWSYEGVRELNSWVSATLSQLTFNDSESIRIGLNDQVVVQLTDLGQTDIAGKKIISVEDSHAAALKNPEYAARYGINQAMITANFENQSKFLVVLKYLTLSNFLYSILTVVTLFYGGKFFRFLLKQR